DTNFVARTAIGTNSRGFVLVRYAREGTALLYPNQEWTHDVFTYCAEGRAFLTEIKPNGGFKYNVPSEDMTVVYSIMGCMIANGFKFENTVDPQTTNFGTRPDKAPVVTKAEKY